MFACVRAPVRLNCFCCRADCGEGCSGEGGVALLGRGGAGDEGVEEVVEEGLLLESGWYGAGMWSCNTRLQFQHLFCSFSSLSSSIDSCDLKKKRKRISWRGRQSVPADRTHLSQRAEWNPVVLLRLAGTICCTLLLRVETWALLL